MREDVTISYRGASYEIGRGPRFYGIWAAGAPRSQPAQWWPETPEGWSAAWSRFTQIESPGTIVAAGRPGRPSAAAGQPSGAAGPPAPSPPGALARSSRPHCSPSASAAG